MRINAEPLIESLRQALERQIMDGHDLPHGTREGDRRQRMVDHVSARRPSKPWQLDGGPPVIAQQVASTAQSPTAGHLATPVEDLDHLDLVQRRERVEQPLDVDRGAGEGRSADIGRIHQHAHSGPRSVVPL